MADTMGNHRMKGTQREIWLIRHGETAWSRLGKHTGRTDVPLTEHGREQARALQPLLAGQHFDLVLSSPLQRAVETCRLAGLGERMQPEPLLLEWDYGLYEGRTSAEMRAEMPGWTIWDAPMPQGETLEALQQRVERLIERLEKETGRIALFAHGHVLRVLAGVWMAGQGRLGAHLLLDTAAVGVLGYEHEQRAIARWNLRPEPGL